MTPTILHGIIYTTAAVSGRFAPSALHELREHDGKLSFSFPVTETGSVAPPTIA